MKMRSLLLAGLICLAERAEGFFAPQVRRLGHHRHQRSALLLRAADEDLDEAAVSALWAMTSKSLLSIGGKGVQDSHVRSLQTLLGQHDVVKVKLSDHRTDSGECVAAFDRGLEGYGRLVDVHGSGRYILYESFSSGVDATSFSLFAARQAATKALKEEKARAYREKGEAMAAEAEKASRGGE